MKIRDFSGLRKKTTIRLVKNRRLKITNMFLSLIRATRRGCLANTVYFRYQTNMLKAKSGERFR